MAIRITGTAAGARITVAGIGWSKDVRGHGDWGRGDHRAGRNNEGFSGSSGGGRGGGGGNHGSGAGGNANGFVGWLGAHGSYR